MTNATLNTMTSSLLTRSHAKALLLLLAVLALSGCATMNEKECLNSDWHAIGFEDGSRGAQASRIGQHRKACAKHAIQPDLKAYNSGREQGLKEYCRPHKGYSAGRKGKTYHGACPTALEAGFLSAYKEGRKIHLAEADIRKLQHAIKKDQRKLKVLNKKLTQIETLLVSNGTGTQRRIELLAEMRGLSKEQGQLEAQIKNRELEQARLQGRLDGLKAASRY